MRTPQYRMITGASAVREAFIPALRRERAAMWAIFDASPEQAERDLAETEAYRIKRNAEREAEVAQYLARHAELVAEHADSPILAVFLRDHAPQVAGQWIECNGCAPFWDHHDEERQPEWPCPTWLLIERGA